MSVSGREKTSNSYRREARGKAAADGHAGRLMETATGNFKDVLGLKFH